MEGQVLNFKYKKGVAEIRPAHPMVSNWVFSEEEAEEATLAHHMAIVAKKSGMTANDLHNIFPAVLRMLKNNSNWSK